LMYFRGKNDVSENMLGNANFTAQVVATNFRGKPRTVAGFVAVYVKKL